MRAGADIDRGPTGPTASGRIAGGGSSDDELAELRHDALAALLGIEAAAQALSRHRHLMHPEQVEELAEGLVAEVRRLRSLLAPVPRADVGACSVGRGDGRPGPDDGVPPIHPTGREPADPASVVASPAESAPVDLRDAVLPMLACARANGLTVQADIAPGIPVAGARDTVVRVLLTLLANARRHAAGSPVEVRASVCGNQVIVRVEDRGPGVPDELQPVLFERGVRSEATGGSGLGLAAARRLVSELGGTVWYEPRLGGGASFRIQLPLAAAAREDDPSSGAGASCTRGPRRVVVSGARVPAPARTLDATGAVVPVSTSRASDSLRAVEHAADLVALRRDPPQVAGEGRGRPPAPAGS